MMEQKLNGFSPSERIRDRLNWIHDTAGDTIGGAFRLELIDCDDQALCYTFHATTPLDAQCDWYATWWQLRGLGRPSHGLRRQLSVCR